MKPVIVILPLSETVFPEVLRRCRRPFALVLAVFQIALGVPVAAISLPADCSTAPIPDQPLEIAIGDDVVALPNATIEIGDGGVVEGNESVTRARFELKGSEDYFKTIRADFEVLILPGSSMDGRTLTMKATKDGSSQEKVAGQKPLSIWSIEHQELPYRASFVGIVASARLELGARKGDVIPGKIQLCVPVEGQDSFFATDLKAPARLAGRFEARVVQP